MLQRIGGKVWVVTTGCVCRLALGICLVTPFVDAPSGLGEEWKQDENAERYYLEALGRLVKALRQPSTRGI